MSMCPQVLGMLTCPGARVVQSRADNDVRV